MCTGRFALAFAHCRDCTVNTLREKNIYKYTLHLRAMRSCSNAHIRRQNGQVSCIFKFLISKRVSTTEATAPAVHTSQELDTSV